MKIILKHLVSRGTHSLMAWHSGLARAWTIVRENFHRLILSLSVVTVAIGGATSAVAQPVYDNDDTRRIVEAMAAAHGGAERFFEAPSFKFSIAMYLYTLGINEDRSSYDNWRYYTVTIDPDTSRAYVEIPHENLDGPEAAVTRDQYWRADYQFDPAFQEGPHILAWFHYSMIALPFLTQIDGAELSRIEDSSLPNSEKTYPTVRMRFSPGSGKSMEGFMDLIIDPDTHLLAGWGQGTPIALLPGDILPPEVPALPGGARFLRVVDKYQTIDGITIPIGYYFKPPGRKLGGLAYSALSVIFGKVRREKASKAPRRKRYS